VILWDLSKDTHLMIFEHPDVPTKVCFNPDVRKVMIEVLYSLITYLFQ